MRIPVRYAGALGYALVLPIALSCNLLTHNVENLKKDTNPPTVAIVEPVEGSGFLRNLVVVTLRAEAADDDSIQKVEFYYNDTVKAGTANEAPWEIEWMKLLVPAGPCRLSAIAFDKAGNATKSDTVIIYINNGSIVLEEGFESNALGNVGPTVPTNDFRPSFSADTEGDLSGFTIIDDPLATRGKVLRMQDSGAAGESTFLQGNFSDVSAGVLDFDFLLEDASRLFYTLSYKISSEGAPRVGVEGSIYRNSGGSHYAGLTDGPGGEGLFGAPLAEDVWHSIRVAFDCEARKFAARLDEAWIFGDFDFSGENGPVNFLLFYSLGTAGYESRILLDGIRLEQKPVQITLLPPTGLTASPRNGDSVTITWTDNCASETEYVIRRFDYLTDPTDSAIIGTIAADLVGFTDSGLLVDHAYQYAVYCQSETGFSPLSDWVIVPAGAALPSDFAVSYCYRTSTTGINLPTTTLTIDFSSGAVGGTRKTESTETNWQTHAVTVISSETVSFGMTEAELLAYRDFIVANDLMRDVAYAAPPGPIKTGASTSSSITIADSGSTYTLNATFPESAYSAAIQELVTMIKLLGD